MTEYSKKQKKVIATAKRQLRNFGITTICLDRLPNHDNFDDNEIVKELVNDTIYWEQIMKEIVKHGYQPFSSTHQKMAIDQNNE
jgi:hypothetical protein